MTEMAIRNFVAASTVLSNVYAGLGNLIGARESCIIRDGHVYVRSDLVLAILREQGEAIRTEPEEAQ